MKTDRFYTTINEAKQLMKLSIYERWIKDKADMYYYTETVECGLMGDYDETRISVGVPSSKYDTPAWSTNALIRVCNSLNLLVNIENDNIIVEDDTLHAISGPNSFSTSMRGYCLPWMLVRVLKQYNKDHGTK